MKAVVLAGGYATRLWPITKDRPKMFLPVGEQTVIDEIFADLEADDRVDEVFVSTNERFAETFDEYLAESDFEKPTLSIEETVEEDEKFGVVGALAQLVDREGVDDDLLVVAGDNLISFDLAEFTDFFQEKATPTLAAYDVGSLERAKSYGLVELDGDQIVDFQEKPDDPKSTLVSIACYAFPAETLPDLATYLEDDNNPDEPGWFLQWLQSREPVHAFTFDGAWYDIGTADSYLDTVEYALDGEHLVADGATVENTELGDVVHVMDGAEVTDSSLERAVVFPEATITDSDVQNSVVDEHATLEDVDLTGSLIGAYTSITSGDDF
ncbi:MAG: nucleoside-diphosphate-sugar pyrophosphorylase [uncultured archaeon A07HR67]|jgi:Nucleoside-diphosphate-sugar pyrophosphorylase involved in lipopolysaccharide biosynthesis/translation initiation factor 2B, gamma/epsilon subunits (eIF-2Bgamma/eIF-2Bepsilon)|nr:MAG: nucleoside-diphosphate-sugar pyrophosphorylase [uncultured archaeon A07HR67]